jgi:8-oxo-dGTP diphosphatase
MIHDYPRFMTVVCGLPINKDGKVLLTQRHMPESKGNHLKWQLAGGSIEFGETPEQALSREFEEELRLPARIVFPYPIVKVSIWKPEDISSKAGLHVTLICYIVDVGPGRPDISHDEETSDARWYTFAEVADLDTLPNTKEFVLEAQKIIEKEKLLKLLP